MPKPAPLPYPEYTAITDHWRVEARTRPEDGKLALHVFARGRVKDEPGFEWRVTAIEPAAARELRGILNSWLGDT